MTECCFVGYGRHADPMIHLFVKRPDTPKGMVLLDACKYTGGSFCSWVHLAKWALVYAADGEFGIPIQPPASGRPREAGSYGE